ncbi:MAG TPA: FAD-dependent oxidoreductase [Roseiflexaceae bacterium]|nr:FAD-dependent oxidoreductase [Roseiflexaceae bacterium]
MDLRSGYAFWPIKNGLLCSYPYLESDVTCDVAVIGGGITGALVSYYLVEAGFDTIVVDRRDIGAGSTSASTALLQYEVDTPLCDLIEMVGRVNAARSYLLCLEAIAKLEQLAERVGGETGFERKKSLYLASTSKDVGQLQREYEARRAAGIGLDYLDRDDIRARFAFDYPAALLSHDGAQVDPFRLMHQLFRVSSERGLRVYDRTEVSTVTYETNGVMLQTDRGPRIRARRVVMATGYESQQFVPQKIVTFHSSYALVSEPVRDFSGWGEDQCLIWETARPYVYMRTTRDKRSLVGGEDDPFDNDEVRDRRIGKKTERLLERFHSMFPAITIEPAYSWAGTFGETKDGLAYIGQHPSFPHTYFALGYGGNGITYSHVAAELIRDAMLGHPNPDADIFRFDR